MGLEVVDRTPRPRDPYRYPTNLVVTGFSTSELTETLDVHTVDQSEHLRHAEISRQRYQIHKDLLRYQAAATSCRSQVLQSKDGLHAVSTHSHGRT